MNQSILHFTISIDTLCKELRVVDLLNPRTELKSADAVIEHGTHVSDLEDIKLKVLTTFSSTIASANRKLAYYSKQIQAWFALLSKAQTTQAAYCATLANDAQNKIVLLKKRIEDEKKSIQQLQDSKDALCDELEVSGSDIDIDLLRPASLEDGIEEVDLRVSDDNESDTGWEVGNVIDGGSLQDDDQVVQIVPRNVVHAAPLITAPTVNRATMSKSTVAVRGGGDDCADIRNTGADGADMKIVTFSQITNEIGLVNDQITNYQEQMQSWQKLLDMAQRQLEKCCATDYRYKALKKDMNDARESITSLEQKIIEMQRCIKKLQNLREDLCVELGVPALVNIEDDDSVPCQLTADSAALPSTTTTIFSNTSLSEGVSVIGRSGYAGHFDVYLPQEESDF